MRKTWKWALPATLALAAVVGWSFTSAVAQNAAAKGKVTVTVKNPEGAAAADVPLSLLKGNVPMPAGGRRGGADGGAPPASQPAPLATGTTNAQGMYTFEGVDAGEITVMAGRGGGGGRRGQGGGAPGGAPPTSAPTGGAAAGGPRGGGGRGVANGMVKAGEELKLSIDLVAGRGGQGGGGGRRGAGQ